MSDTRRDHIGADVGDNVTNPAIGKDIEQTIGDREYGNRWLDRGNQVYVGNSGPDMVVSAINQMMDRMDRLAGVVASLTTDIRILQSENARMQHDTRRELSETNTRVGRLEERFDKLENIIAESRHIPRDPQAHRASRTVIYIVGGLVGASAVIDIGREIVQWLTRLLA